MHEPGDPTNDVLSRNRPTLTATGVITYRDGLTFDRALFVSDPVVRKTDPDVILSTTDVTLGLSTFDFRSRIPCGLKI